MYTILVTNSNEMITTSKERIMRRTKLVDKLHFLVDPIYNGYDMSTFTVTLEYKLPVSGDPCTETLVLSEELYKEKLEYVLPIDTKLTKEAGTIALQLTFTAAMMDADGKVTYHVRKAGPGSITIVPISTWTDSIPDAALGAFDQRLLMTDAMINALVDAQDTFDDTKADNLYLDENTYELQLEANGNKIGRKIAIVTPKIKDGEFDGWSNGMLELDEADLSGGEVPDSNPDDCDCPDFVEL